jgi:2-acylglycerol O-acyltransferase 2
MPHLLKFREYFPSQLVKTAELDPKKPHMLCIHPHGIIGMSVWANFMTHSSGGFNAVFPGVDLRVVTLESNFSIPFFRDYLYSMGCIGSDKKTILGALQHKMSVLLVVGGAEESLHARPGNRDIVIKKRYGFVRLALIAGASLVPVFAFGENELYKQVDNPKGSKLRIFQEKLKKILGFTLPMVNGRGIFMYSIGFMPHRRWLCTLIGKPIDLPKIENPSPTEVEHYHKIYMEALRDLYEDNKVKLGYGHKKIHFI